MTSHSSGGLSGPMLRHNSGIITRVRQRLRRSIAYTGELGY
jgi:hypothetical protein